MAAREGVGVVAVKRRTRVGCERVTGVRVHRCVGEVKDGEASWGYMVKPHGSLVRVSFNALLHFHTPPINQVVYLVP